MRHKKSFSEQMYRRRLLMGRLRVLALLFVLYEFIAGVFIKTYVISSGSMFPTLRIGDAVLATPLAYGPLCEAFGFRLPGFGKPQRGDIVVVDSPHREDLPWYSYLADDIVRFVTLQRIGILESAHAVASRTIKRIIGAPGDVVYLKDYTYYVKTSDDAHFLTEFERSGHIYDIRTTGMPRDWSKAFPLSDSHGVLTLGPDEYFVVGDARTGSTDSRLFGTVASSKFVSKVILRYWPFDRFGIPY